MLPKTSLREAQLEEIFRRRVRQVLRGVVSKLAPTTAGMPDRLVILPEGRLYLVELKTETGVLSPIQKEWHQRVKALGTPVYVLYGGEDIRQWVRDRVNEVAPPESETDQYGLPQDEPKKAVGRPAKHKCTYPHANIAFVGMRHRCLECLQVSELRFTHRSGRRWVLI
jgi:hypothetical protein